MSKGTDTIGFGIGEALVRIVEVLPPCDGHDVVGILAKSVDDRIVIALRQVPPVVTDDPDYGDATLFQLPDDGQYQAVVEFDIHQGKVGSAVIVDEAQPVRWSRYGTDGFTASSEHELCKIGCCCCVVLNNQDATQETSNTVSANIRMAPPAPTQ